MSKKNEIIDGLRKEVSDLKTRLSVTENVNNKFGRIYKQNLEIARDNPILTLPSGKQILFSELSREQLEYLESLEVKKYTKH